MKYQIILVQTWGNEKASNTFEVAVEAKNSEDALDAVEAMITSQNKDCRWEYYVKED